LLPKRNVTTIFFLAQIMLICNLYYFRI